MIPRWFPKKKEFCPGGLYSKEAGIAIRQFNKAIDLCLTAFLENMPAKEELTEITERVSLDNMNPEPTACRIADAIHTRLMEGKK